MHRFQPISTLVALVALLLFAPLPAARAQVYTDFAQWQAAVQPNPLSDSFTGQALGFNPYFAFSQSGFGFTIGASNTGSTAMTRYTRPSPAINALMPTNNHGTLVISPEYGRPFNAVWLTVGIASGLASFEPTAGTLEIRTDTGACRRVDAPIGGVSIGFITDHPIRWLTVAWTSPGLGNPYIDQLVVGESINHLNGSDECDTAPTIGAGEWFADTTAATTSALIPPSPCEHIGSDVWYRYIAGTSGHTTITTDRYSFDSVLTIYGGNCAGTLAAPIACNDDYQGFAYSTVTFPTAAGQVYMVRLGGYDPPGGTLPAHGPAHLVITEAAGCPGDFNHSGTVSVQDLFDFLAAYFAMCP